MVLLPELPFIICILVGILSIISDRCDMTPILRPWLCNLSSASMAVRRVSLSSEPNPSSMNSDSMFMRFDDSDDSANANANDTRKDSPPDSECTERDSDSISRSITFMASESGDVRASS